MENDYSMGMRNRKGTKVRTGAQPVNQASERTQIAIPLRTDTNLERRQPEDLLLISDTELISLRTRVETEMRRRNIDFSVGDIGEQLVIDYFNSTPGLPNLMRAPRGTKNVDALSRNGDRYSIKTIWKAKKTGTVYPDQDSKTKQLFEFIVIAQLDEEWRLRALSQFTWRQFCSIRSWDKRMNAWYISCSTKLLQKSMVWTTTQNIT
jgi:hypothetical protein